MARRRGKLVLGILGGVLGVFVLAVVLLPLLVPREKLRSLAEQQVREATGGEVTLGEVSLKVLPRLRLVLGASRLQVTGGGLRGAGQDPGPLLAGDVALQRLEVDLALWPLLRRQLEFGEITVVAPALHLTTRPVAPREEGAAAEPEPAEATAPPALDFGLALAAVTVRDGEVSWREEGTGRAVTVSGWQQDLAAPALGVLLARLQRLGGAELPADGVDGPVAATLSARIARITLDGFGEHPLPPLTDLDLVAEVSLPAAADRAEFTVPTLTMPGWRATAAGHATLERLTLTRLDVAGGDALALGGTASFTLPPAIGPLTADLDGQVDLATIMDQLAPWLPPVPADQPPPPALTGTLAVKVAASLPTPPPLDAPDAWIAGWRQGLPGTATMTATGGPITVSAPQLGEPLRIATLAVDSDLRAAAGKTRLRANGLAHPAVAGDAVVELQPAAGPDEAVSARLELPRLDLDALAALVETLQTASATSPRHEPRHARLSLVPAAWASTAAAAPAPAPGELIPADLKVDLAATVQQITFLKSDYTGARLSGSLRERVIAVRELSARLGTGQLSGTARVDYAADPRGRASWDVQVKDAPAGLMLQPYVPVLAAIWTGTMSATASGSCDLSDPQAILRSLSLNGDLRGSNGVVDLREQLGGVSQYLGQRQDLLRVQYNQARQHFRIADGKVMLENLRLDGRDTDWRGGGWLGLDGAVNLDLNVRLPAGFTPDLGEFTFLADALRDKDGRIALDFSLTGEARRPAVSLKLDPASLIQSDAIKNKLKDEGKEQLQKLQEDLKKGAGGIIDRWRRGGNR